MEKRYKFKCPKCGCEQLREFLIDYTTFVTVTDIFSENGETELIYNNNRMDDADLTLYRCAECNFFVTDNMNDIINKITENGWGEKI